MESYLESNEFKKSVKKKVGPNSDYKYRSKFDPVSSDELKTSANSKKSQ